MHTNIAKGGAAVFSKIESEYGEADAGFSWSYVNSLYFCDVSMLAPARIVTFKGN